MDNGDETVEIGIAIYTGSSPSFTFTKSNGLPQFKSFSVQNSQEFLRKYSMKNIIKSETEHATDNPDKQMEGKEG